MSSDFWISVLVGVLVARTFGWLLASIIKEIRAAASDIDYRNFDYTYEEYRHYNE